MNIILESQDKKALKRVANQFKSLTTGEIKGNRFYGQLDVEKTLNAKINIPANNKTNIEKAREYIIRRKQEGGWWMTYERIADELNKREYKTSRGKKFHKMTVKRIFDKYIQEKSNNS